MATFDQRIGPDGKRIYRVRIRRKGYATQTATFSKLSEAKQWAQITEDTVLEGRHIPTPEAKRHTVTDLLDRYSREVLPHKKLSTIKTQRQQLHWWQTHLGHYLLNRYYASYAGRASYHTCQGTCKRYCSALLGCVIPCFHCGYAGMAMV